MAESNWTLGIDVNHWRGYVNWQQVAADPQKVRFAIVKATEGVFYVDDTFDPGWVGMRRTGLLRGAYLFLNPTVDPIAQADHFMATMKGILHPSDLPPILDIEKGTKTVREAWFALSASERLNIVRKCLKRLEQAAGRKPIVYTNTSSWIELCSNTQEFSEYPLWIANYGVETPNLPANNWGGKGWTIWQYSESGVVQGVNNGKRPVDMIWFNGSIDQLRTVFGLSAALPLAPECSNIEMARAFEQVAPKFGKKFEDLLASAGLAHIYQVITNRGRPYDGLAIEQLPLASDIRLALSEALKKSAGIQSETYAISNQDMLNAFYEAAVKLREDGWKWLVAAGLTNLAEARLEQYNGPTVEAMLGLSEAKKNALRKALGLQEQPLQDQEITPTYPDLNLTNQKLLNALYRAAGTASQDGWEWVEIAGLAYIAGARKDFYSGPLVENLPGLDAKQKNALKAALQLPVAPTPPKPVSETYPGLDNQDLINAFYNVAGRLGVDAWKWISGSNLAYLVKTRKDPYKGPKVEDLPALTPDQKLALSKEVAALMAG